jgi:NTP pyrophosphatase (non-canonical NTP hydrolase)
MERTKQFIDTATAGKILQRICHDASIKAGWWSCPKTGERSSPEYIKASLIPQKLLLIHTEISEATEADRTDSMDKHLPHRHGVEVELADAAIRIFDLAGALGFNLGDAIAEKMEFNARRADHKAEARSAKNGKRY